MLPVLVEPALDVDVAHGRCLHAEADRDAFRHEAVGGARRHALHAVDLIEKVGELGARALEAGGVDVGDIVGDDFEIGLLGIHARGGDGECFHDDLPFCTALQIAIRLTSM